MDAYEVIVAGGGMAGLATAEALSRRGRRVALVERYEAGHSNGSSHGDGRVIRYSYDSLLLMTLAQAAYPLWDKLSERAGQPLTQLTGGLDFGTEGSEVLQAVIANCEQRGVPYELIEPGQLASRFPAFRPFDDDQIVYQESSGVAFADKVVSALWRLGEENGAEFVTEDPIVSARETDHGVEVTTASGRTLAAEQLVVTAGNWTNQLLSYLDLAPLDYEAQQVQVSHFLPVSDVPHTLGHVPVFIDHRSFLYGLPEIQTPGFKLGAHTDGIALDEVEKVLPVHQATIDKMADYVTRRFPHLDTAPSTTITCRYTMMANERFVMSRHPGSQRVIVGSGFCGEGFKYTPLVGEVLADLVAEAVDGQADEVSASTDQGERSFDLSEFAI